MKVFDKDRDLRCTCVRLLVDISAEYRSSYRDIGDGFYADVRCLCKGEGIDPRLFMLWEMVEDGTQLMSTFSQRIAELEQHVLRLNARLSGKPEPPPGAEYVSDIDGP